MIHGLRNVIKPARLRLNVHGAILLRQWYVTIRSKLRYDERDAEDLDNLTAAFLSSARDAFAGLPFYIEKTPSS